ncbi:hypothetical protein O6P43_013825 [Quillaja saponaria]|uniref:Uncharacterized protein n=1 Tax=Quillaja saponaria TaxID=32244 RepID=A0AAD7PR17_QUISA|nr:hypothetical protein O6P43_013825 [Quillaja saponaria]
MAFKLGSDGYVGFNHYSPNGASHPGTLHSHGLIQEVYLTSHEAFLFYLMNILRPMRRALCLSAPLMVFTSLIYRPSAKPWVSSFCLKAFIFCFGDLCLSRWSFESIYGLWSVAYASSFFLGNLSAQLQELTTLLFFFAAFVIIGGGLMPPPSSRSGG